jgi:hypothetical protein
MSLTRGGGRPATCNDAAPSGAHASSIREHARIFTANDGSDMADEAAFAVENFPTVSTLGFSFLELGLLEGLDELVAYVRAFTTPTQLAASADRRAPADRREKLGCTTIGWAGAHGHDRCRDPTHKQTPHIAREARPRHSSVERAVTAQPIHAERAARSASRHSTQLFCAPELKCFPVNVTPLHPSSHAVKGRHFSSTPAKSCAAFAMPQAICARRKGSSGGHSTQLFARRS